MQALSSGDGTDMESTVNIQMEIIPEPKPGEASVLVFAKQGPYVMIRGDAGDTNYLCGTCQNIICERVTRGMIVNLVFKCPNCGSFNRVRGT
jgi:DNA-directed RNA polymerase subunit RPC12/RpoP